LGRFATTTTMASAEGFHRLRRRLSLVLLLLVPAVPFQVCLPRRVGPSSSSSSSSSWRRCVGPLGSSSSNNDPDRDVWWDQFTKDEMQLELEERIAEMKIGGSNRVAAQYVILLTKKHPSELVREFYASASPAAAVAVTEAVNSVVSNLGGGTVHTTAEQIANLCFKLQMTGYMLRNAEYVLALREVFSIDKPTRKALRKAFDDVDQDKDGYLSMDEVSLLFDKVYYHTTSGGGAKAAAVSPAAAAGSSSALSKNASAAAMPVRVYPNGDEDSSSLSSSSSTSLVEARELKTQQETKSFMEFFDADFDGKVSFDEFARGLGGSAELLDRADEVEARAAAEASPISGQIELLFPNGKVQTVDAAEYVDDLRREARDLRAALAARRGEQQLPGSALVEQRNTLATYVDSLDGGSKDALTDTLTPDAEDAMSQLINYIFSGGGDGAPPPVPDDAKLKVEQQFLRELMQLQLITGYRIRELEALDIPKERAGKNSPTTQRL